MAGHEWIRITGQTNNCDKYINTVTKRKMREILSLYGIPEKYIKIIKTLYEKCSAKIEQEGEFIQKINVSNLYCDGLDYTAISG